MMRIIAILSLAFSLIGCNDSDDIKASNIKTDKKNASGDELSMSPKYQAFEKEFHNKFAGYTSLAPQTLFQIIEAVPEQGVSSWNCGKVQSALAIASASIVVGAPIDKASLSQCDVIENYPLLADVVISDEGKKALKKAGYSPLFDTDGHFRVGALAHMLPAYLNAKDRLPPSIRARHVKKNTLTVDDFITQIDKALALKMPLIVLYVINPDKMQLHYYGVVGYDKNKLNIMLLETDGEVINRLSIKEIEDFVRHLNTDDFVIAVKNIAPGVEALKYLYKITGKLPNISDLAGLGVFNIIAFDKIN